MTGYQTPGTAIRQDDTVASTDANHDGDAAAKSIKNKTYLFNEDGIMLTGLYELTGVHKGTSVVPMDYGYYYFTIDDSHSSVEGQMVTNKRVTIDVHGEDKTYYFSKDGRAYKNVIISGSVFGPNGQLITSYGDGSAYDQVTLGAALTKKDDNGKVLVPAGSRVLINGNGKIKQNGTVTDVNGDKVTVSNYIVTQINGVAVN